MTEAYPLTWPEGMPRTRHPVSAPFKITQDKAQRHLLHEIYLLGGREVIISTNIPIRRDGMPYADAARRRMEDPGVAVYFVYKGEQKCFACDKWDTVTGNMRAVGKTIEALRGIERWGSGDMMDRAFKGYTALPAPARWWTILGVERADPLKTIADRYFLLAKKYHPDNRETGDNVRMQDINRAWGEAQKEKSL